MTIWLMTTKMESYGFTVDHFTRCHLILCAIVPLQGVIVSFEESLRTLTLFCAVSIYLYFSDKWWTSNLYGYTSISISNMCNGLIMGHFKSTIWEFSFYIPHSSNLAPNLGRHVRRWRWYRFGVLLKDTFSRLDACQNEGLVPCSLQRVLTKMLEV